YQQNMHLSARHRAMLNPLGHHEYLTLIEGDRAVPKLDVERSSEHKEEIVSVVVLVPVKWPLKLGDHDVVAVVGCNRTRGKAVSESRELLGKVGGDPHHGFSLRTALGNPVLDSLHVIRSRATFLDDQCRSELLIGAAMLRCSFRHEDTSTPRRSLSPTQIDKPPAPRASHLGFPDLMMVVVMTGRLCSPRTCRARFCAPAACPGRLPDPHTSLSD